MAEETRTTMWCDVCRQADDHPRHHVLLADGTVQTLHMDCCRDSAKCPDETCHDILSESGEQRGHALLAWIKGNK